MGKGAAMGNGGKSRIRAGAAQQRLAVSMILMESPVQQASATSQTTRFAATSSAFRNFAGSCSPWSFARL
jgi:hypothetical protein